jgi:hypothetical protein
MDARARKKIHAPNSVKLPFFFFKSKLPLFQMDKNQHHMKPFNLLIRITTCGCPCQYVSRALEFYFATIALLVLHPLILKFEATM